MATDSAAEPGSVSQPLSGNATLALPIIFDIDAMRYGYFTVRQYDDGRLEAIGEVPDRVSFSRSLLESADHPACTWDGKRITVTLSNGSWSWDAEARNSEGTVIYAGPTRD